MLEAVKKALRISAEAYDSELLSLIEAASRDLKLAGIEFRGNNDPLVNRAIITYVRVHFGSPADYDRLKASYDEQKAQLQTASGYGLDGDESW